MDGAALDDRAHYLGWDVADDPEAWLDLVEREKIGDGLPVVPPTPERLERWLHAIDRAGTEVLGILPPGQGQLTTSALAINAIMAGAAPSAFPILENAFAAMLQPEFNLLTIQVTTNPVTPLLMVSGPIATTLSLNGAAGYLGPGSRANATIGRAIRLTMMNVGGAFPGAADRATAGQPGKFSLAFAENVADSPWESLAAARGISQGDALTVFGAVSIVNHVDSKSSTARDILANLGATLTLRGTNFLQTGGEVLILFCPEHARSLSDEGYSRRSIQEELFDIARTPAADIPEATLAALKWRRSRFPTTFVGGDVRALDLPENAVIAVAGGPGKHTVVVYSLSSTMSVTRPIL